MLHDRGTFKCTLPSNKKIPLKLGVISDKLNQLSQSQGILVFSNPMLLISNKNQF